MADTPFHIQSNEIIISVQCIPNAGPESQPVDEVTAFQNVTIPNVGSMLGRRRSWWANNKSTLVQRPAFVEKATLR